MKCDNCGKNSKEANLLKAKDDEGKQVYICEVASTSFVKDMNL